MTIEAMKMEVPIEAPARGVVHTLHVSAGEQVAEGQCLVTLE